jgi:hypothetical protein
MQGNILHCKATLHDVTQSNSKPSTTKRITKYTQNARLCRIKYILAPPIYLSKRRITQGVSNFTEQPGIPGKVRNEEITICMRDKLLAIYQRGCLTWKPLTLAEAIYALLRLVE